MISLACSLVQFEIDLCSRNHLAHKRRLGGIGLGIKVSFFRYRFSQPISLLIRSTAHFPCNSPLNMHRNSVYTTAFDDNDREISSASATTTGTPQNGVQGQENLPWNLNQGQSGSSGPATSSITSVPHAGHPLLGPYLAHVASLPQVSGSEASLDRAAHTDPFLQISSGQIFQAAHGSIPQVLGHQPTYLQWANGDLYPPFPGSQTTFPRTAHAVPPSQVLDSQAAFFPGIQSTFSQAPSGQATFPQGTQVSNTTSSSLGQEIQPSVIQATSMANFMNATLAGDTDKTYVFSPPPRHPPVTQAEGHGHAEERTISWKIRTDAPRLSKQRYTEDEKTTIRCLVENDLPFSSVQKMTGSPKGTTSRFHKQPSEVQMVKIESRKQLDKYFFDLTVRRVP